MERSIVIQIITFPGWVNAQAGVSDASASHRQFVGEKALAHRAKELRYENAGGEKASSTLWRGYIWQSLPTENMSGPDPDPVSQAYQANGWRPIFIDSRFRLNNGATLLLSRLGELENQAIDPRPFKLDALSKSLEKLVKAGTLSAAPTLSSKTSGRSRFRTIRRLVHPLPAGQSALRGRKKKSRRIGEKL